MRRRVQTSTIYISGGFGLATVYVTTPGYTAVYLLSLAFGNADIS